MVDINLIGGGFQHAHSSTWWKKSEIVNWVKDKSANISFYVDDAIITGLNDNDDKIKYAWFNESKAITPNVVNYGIQNYKLLLDKYELIFTNYKQLCKLSSKFIWTYVNSYWVETPKIYEKTKLVSMVASNKIMCKGHEYRKQYIDKFKDLIDLFGRGYKDITLKEEGLKDYMFSVAMENDKYETYFTEKILDCFATGTIPIYWGTPDIGDHFNMEGIIILDDNFTVDMLSKDLYYSKIDAVKDNFERVMNLDFPEDWIYKNYLQ